MACQIQSSWVVCCIPFRFADVNDSCSVNVPVVNQIYIYVLLCCLQILQTGGGPGTEMTFELVFLSTQSSHPKCVISKSKRHHKMIVQGGRRLVLCLFNMSTELREKTRIGGVDNTIIKS
jgi:hypothetical protein